MKIQEIKSWDKYFAECCCSATTFLPHSVLSKHVDFVIREASNDQKTLQYISTKIKERQPRVSPYSWLAHTLPLLCLTEWFLYTFAAFYSGWQCIFQLLLVGWGWSRKPVGSHHAGLFIDCDPMFMFMLDNQVWPKFRLLLTSISNFSARLSAPRNLKQGSNNWFNEPKRSSI